jgi:ParB-like chromosome segregation protein Spo0J
MSDGKPVTELRVEYVEPDSLRPAPYNPRRMGRRALKRLAALLDRHGFVAPVIARREDRLVIGGHQRIEANRLRQRPDQRVPVLFLAGIDDEQAKALNIALNNRQAQGQFDPPRLAELLAELASGDLDLPAATGFDEAEIADLTGDLAAPSIPEGIEPVAGEGDVADGGEGVVLIFEMPRQTYARLKPQFDTLIAEHDLTCHVRIDGG